MPKITFTSKIITPPRSVELQKHTPGFGVVFHLLGGLWDYSPVIPQMEVQGLIQA